jgi:hypothetical protein
MTILQHWIPAFAGMTPRTSRFQVSHTGQGRRVPLSSPNVRDELGSYDFTTKPGCRKIYRAENAHISYPENPVNPV